MWKRLRLDLSWNRGKEKMRWSRSRQEGKIVGTRKIKWSNIAMGENGCIGERKKFNVSFFFGRRGRWHYRCVELKGRERLLCLPVFFEEIIKILCRKTMKMDRWDPNAVKRQSWWWCRIQCNQRSNCFAGKLAKQKECLYWKRSASLAFFYHSICVVVAEGHGVKERVSQIWDWIISDSSGLAFQWLSDISKS